MEPTVAEEVFAGRNTGPTVSTYTPQVAPELSTYDNHQRGLKLLYDIRNSNKSDCMPPTVSIIDLDRLRPSTSTQPVDVDVQQALPEECFDFALPISFEISVNNYPLPICDFPHKFYSSVFENGFREELDRFVNSLVFSDADLNEIDKITCGQSENCEWYKQREGAITGTKAHRILSYVKYERATPENIVFDIMQYRSQKVLTPAIEWGIKNETRALDQYYMCFQQNHSDTQLIKPGLLVLKENPFIRVSPDAIISCSCHGKRVVEIKCPYTLRNEDINESIAKGNCDYLLNDNENVSLKVHHQRGYFEQITMQMALTCAKNADFVLWTKMNFATVNVQFNEKFHENELVPSLIYFFRKFVAAEILTQRIKNCKHLYSDLLFKSAN